MRNPPVFYECTHTYTHTQCIRRHNVSSEDESAAIPKKRGSSKKRRTASTNERVEPTSPKFGGIFRQPPTGQKRFVYLDPRQPKYGFRLEVM